MNQYETARHHPDSESVEKLFPVLDVPAPLMYCKDDELARMIAGFSKLSESDKRRILKSIGKVE